MNFHWLKFLVRTDDWTDIIGTLRGPRGPKNSRKKRHLRRMKHHKGYKWMGLDGNLWNIKDTKWRPQRWCERRWWELGAASRDRIISWQSSTPRYEWKVLPGWCWWWWLRYCVECFMSRYLNKPFCIFGIYDRPLGSWSALMIEVEQDNGDGLPSAKILISLNKLGRLGWSTPF